MIKNLMLKASLFLSLAYLSISCSSDDPSPTKDAEQSLITMHVTPDYYIGDAYW